MTRLKNQRFNGVNYDLKIELFKIGVTYQDLADWLDLSARTISRRLSKPLTSEEAEEIKNIAFKIIESRS